MLVRLALCAAILILSAARANAVIWCRQPGGPGYPCGPSHPKACARALNEALWKAFPKIMASHTTPEFYCQPSGPGGRLQAQATVDSSWASCVRSRMSASVSGVSVLIVPTSVAVVENADANTAFYGYSVRYASRKSVHNSKRAAAYSRILTAHGTEWMALPGVIGIEPVGCDCSRCDYSGVMVDVQRQFLDSVRKVIPSSVDGVPVEVIPRD